MKRAKYVFCVLAATLLTVLPALAAEEKEGLVQENIHVELIQDGSFLGEANIPNLMQPFGHALEDQLYERLYQGLKAKETSINIEDMELPFDENGEAIFDSVYAKVVNDHPELYYVTGGCTTYGYPDGSYTTIEPYYNDLLQTDEAEFYDAVAEALSVVDTSMSDLEKALALHDYLVLHVAYNWQVAGGVSIETGDPAYTAYGALVNGDAVCQGYALAYKLLLNECGITCTTVTSKQLNHMWNAVQLAGDPNWYYVDVTWDDPVNDKYGRCMHNNFLLSEDGLKATGHKKEGLATDWSFNPSNDASVTYESGWVFNDVDTALYRWNGYYYIKNQRETNDKGSYLTGSTLYYCNTLNLTSGEKTVYCFGGLNMGIVSAVWVDNKVYGLEYFDQKVVCVELVHKDAKTVWTGDEQSGNGYNYGLLYNAKEGALEIWSDLSRTNGTRTQKDAVLIENYPSDWDQVSKDTTALAGARWKDDTSLQMGVVYGGSGDIPALWAAFYDNGEMTGISRVDTSALTRGLNILELSAPAERTKEVRLFLLSAGSWTPCGEKVTVP